MRPRRCPTSLHGLTRAVLRLPRGRRGADRIIPGSILLRRRPGAEAKSFLGNTLLPGLLAEPALPLLVTVSLRPVTSFSSQHLPCRQAPPLIALTCETSSVTAVQLFRRAGVEHVEERSFPADSPHLFLIYSACPFKGSCTLLTNVLLFKSEAIFCRNW